ncbi:MAG: hypothetical protein IPO07_26060 [Haliscomenobacter sp.]|nr:hypothetical protein [Haliscomenobacter sp.]MBK9491876.1 hypothetical protein [Haliscomenobacter sp.]
MSTQGKKLDFAARKSMFLIPTLLCLLLCGTACNLINPVEDIPAYIWIAPFEVQTTGVQGSASAKITEVWLSVDGSFFGVYALPARIPILKTGATLVKLEAGIKDNGISTTPEIYPFFQPLEFNIELKANEIDSIRPKATYRSGIRFAFVENFESNSHVFQTLVTGNESNRMSITNEGAFEGSGSGLIQLSTQYPAVELATRDAYSGLLAKGSAVYLELNYKSEVPLSVGVIAYKAGNLSGGGQILYSAGFNPSENWNKIYFNLSRVVADSKLDDYQIILKTEIPKNTDGTTLRPNARIWLDNVKLVHF